MNIGYKAALTSIFLAATVYVADQIEIKHTYEGEIVATSASSCNKKVNFAPDPNACTFDDQKLTALINLPDGSAVNIENFVPQELLNGNLDNVLNHMANQFIDEAGYKDISVTYTSTLLDKINPVKKQAGQLYYYQAKHLEILPE